jgi:hypothetical protein
MIKILKTVKKEKGLCLIVTEIDAKAADINTEYEKDVIDYRLEELRDFKLHLYHEKCN